MEITLTETDLLEKVDELLIIKNNLSDFNNSKDKDGHPTATIYSAKAEESIAKVINALYQASMDLSVFNTNYYYMWPETETPEE